MRIGKTVKIITRPDLIPVKLPPVKPAPILIPNWPVKIPEKVSVKA